MKKLRKNIVGGIAAIAGLLNLVTIGPAQAQTAPSTSSVEIFGDLSLGWVHQTGTNAPTDKIQSSLAWANSFGFRGREDLGGGLSAIYVLVSSVDVDTGVIGNATSYFKNSYVGLSDTTLGTLTLGRNDELMSMLCSLDVMCYRGLIHTLRPGNLDRVGGGQLANMVRYNSPDIGPFRFKAYGVLGEGVTTPNGRASGFQGDYRSGNLQVGAAYETINNVSVSPGSPGGGFGLTSFFGTPAGTATAFNLDRVEITGLGARYSTGPVTFYGLATKTNLVLNKQQNAMKSYNFGAAYQFNEPLELAGGCSRVTFDPSRWTTCEARLTYNLSKRTSLFAVYANQKAAGAFARPQMFLQGGFGDVGGSTNMVSAGIRHIF